MGTDIDVVNAARVSYDGKAGVDPVGDKKLINYLWKNKHSTPFETVAFTFEVKAPIFVFRQWHRHRTWSYNELSARYQELPEEFYVPELDQITTQSKDNKQMRTTDENNRAEYMQDLMKDSNTESFIAYKEMLSMGCPRELARSVLPVATYSRMFGTVNLLNLLKFATLRSHNHAQYEIQVYSDALLELIRPFVPDCVEAWEATHVR
jgi:thymidylate synthase (FAD)